ncbi:hypothetical protein ACHHYP_15972 [Achlya hypogyna]|uniref:Uncharacterized protein n=1 Tax=Achlya hypogyna TaxID=1202772 RepID=A0A1V9Y9R2_ACHHY|nr:hypothetical protein ACHHYP_15972 [Achlya hypogyna]
MLAAARRFFPRTVVRGLSTRSAPVADPAKEAQVEAAWRSLKEAPAAVPVKDYLNVWHESLHLPRPALTHQVWTALTAHFPHELSIDMFEATAAALLGYDDQAVIDLFDTQIAQRPGLVTDTFRGIAIRAFCDLDQADKADALVAELKTTDMHLQARVLYAYARLGDNVACDRIKAALEAAPSTWTAKGCDNVLRALGTLYPIDTVFDFFQRMLAQGILPTPTSVRLLLQACLYGRHTAHLDRLLTNIPKLKLPSDPALLQAQIAGHASLGHGFDTMLPLTAALATTHPTDARTLPTLYDVFYNAMDQDDVEAGLALLAQLAPFPVPPAMLFKVVEALPDDADDDLWRATEPLLLTALAHHKAEVPPHLCTPVFAACHRRGDVDALVKLFHAVAMAGVVPSKTALGIAAKSCKMQQAPAPATRASVADAVAVLVTSWQSANPIESAHLVSLALFGHAPGSVVTAILQRAAEWDPVLVSSALSALGQVEDLEALDVVYADAVARGAADDRVHTQYVRLLLHVGRHRSMKTLATVLPTAPVPVPLAEDVLVAMMRCRRYKQAIRLLPLVPTRPETFVRVFHEGLSYARSKTWLTRLYDLCKHRARLPAEDLSEYRRLLDASAGTDQVTK